ncbi:MAG: OmpA family protein [Cyanobacteria bacterium P01_F01_bin.42]
MKASHSQPSESLDELRDLIFGQTVGDRVDDLVDDRLSSFQVNAENIAEVLPKAVGLAPSGTLVSAVRPTVEDTIRESVNQDEEILAEALFPIIGPATRKAVTTAIKNLTDSLNQGLELSLSPRSIGWRLESWRTGRPFAEVVLLRTLLYQVEQVLLIHRETGLRLNDVVATTVTVQDPELVSSMLTAIEDFVKDSFATASDSHLDSVEIGDLTLWIEEGPQAVLACAIRGVAPKSLRTLMQESLEKIHRQYDAQLEAFSGDCSPLDDTEAYLRACLLSKVKVTSEAESKGRSPLFWLLGGVMIGALILGAWLVYAQYRWRSLIHALEREPGITITRSKRGWFRREIKGLRDPLALDPRQVVKANRMEPSDITLDFEPYWSLSPDLLEDRARQLLAAPDDVDLEYDPATLTLTAIGSAPYDWIQSANQFPASQARFTVVETSQVEVAEATKLRELGLRVGQTTLTFREGLSVLDSAQDPNLESLAKLLQEAIRLGAKIRQPTTVYVLGKTSAAGSFARNARLRQARADLVVKRLIAAGVPGDALKAEGIAVQPGVESTEQKAQVGFRVEFGSVQN